MLHKISDSVWIVFGVCGVLLVYFIANGLFRPPQDIQDTEYHEPLFSVVTQKVEARSIAKTLVMRGQTQALRTVIVRAQTAGQVTATPAAEGDAIVADAVLCRLDLDSREATYAQAQAAYEKALLDHQAIVTLVQKGFQSEISLASAKAALDQASAQKKRVVLDIAKTKIIAPFAGTLMTQMAEQGDFLTIGTPCALVAQLNPIRIVGSVSERQVGMIKKGNQANVIVAGRLLPAIVTFVSSSANDTTRTFTVELDAENPKMIRDGLTATATIETGAVQAHLIPRRSLVLDDEGVLGVRFVATLSTDSDEGNVMFLPVTQLQDDDEGIWVTGLTGTLHIITRGQNYVTQGQKVISTPQNLTVPSSLAPTPLPIEP